MGNLLGSAAGARRKKRFIALPSIDRLAGKKKTWLVTMARFNLCLRYRNLGVTHLVPNTVLIAWLDRYRREFHSRHSPPPCGNVRLKLELWWPKKNQQFPITSLQLKTGVSPRRPKISGRIYFEQAVNSILWRDSFNCGQTLTAVIPMFGPVEIR